MENLTPPINPLLIGIAGGSGSGKTTFALKVLDLLKGPEVCLLHMDSYYLPQLPQEIYTASGHPNFDHPLAFDWPLLKQHLRELKEGKTIESPIYNFKQDARSDSTIRLGPCKIILFEGIFSLFDEEIRDLLDIKCFLHVDSDIRFTRRLRRDVRERGRSLESVIEQYYETVRPMHQKYLEPQKQYADFTVGEETDIAASILSAKILLHKGQLSHQEMVFEGIPPFNSAFSLSSSLSLEKKARSSSSVLF